MLWIAASMRPWLGPLIVTPGCVKTASYYDEARTHLSLGKDAPISRPIEEFGRMLGGLHHRYARN